MDLSEEDQKMEIPYAYQDSVIDDAARELLENNPEDSAEYKRSIWAFAGNDGAPSGVATSILYFCAHSASARYT